MMEVATTETQTGVLRQKRNSTVGLSSRAQASSSQKKQRRESAEADVAMPPPPLQQGLEDSTPGSSSSSSAPPAMPVPPAHGLPRPTESGAPAASDDADAPDDRSRGSLASGDGRGESLEKLKQELEQQKELNRTLRATVQRKEGHEKKARGALASTLKEIARREDDEERTQVASAASRLGKMVQAGAMKGSPWQGGYEAEEIEKVKERIKEDKASIAKLRLQLSKKAKQSAAEDGIGTGSGDEGEDIPEVREICSHRTAFLTREENAIREREQRLAAERQLHFKKLQRLQAASASAHRNYPLFKNRYQILNLIGRGGFSEVFRAYDLESLAYRAVKIHAVSTEMTDDQRRNYVKHCMREYEIQLGLNHPRVVRLLEGFKIHDSAFVTVLEFCEGVTLDEYLKQHGQLPEKEARGIIIQVLSGLRYLNSVDHRNYGKIIHYDLKPQNLFIDCGEVKIADFGLSKVVQATCADTIELTSHGAGTYWYLPPECLTSLTQGETPRISNKVDVWSTGVIMYEMLFARRPFGHRQSQEQLLRSMHGAPNFDVDFPPTPKVSQDVKEFIKRLLTKDRDQRPDVLAAYGDPYFKKSPSRLSTGGAPAPPGPAASSGAAQGQQEGEPGT
eukprot:CAMPEP_0178378654 /NCGR_PEP_ID=MMETSP0689_2-20121128/4540_1 /TAXON_ID=160604 /ORGANISM="Amphidinium massartii, Strain CS-259" /LENGTH=620 /DNA_ID=CAMNT_0019998735 /DNA_START=140 /DNA_END=1998 /DNA_ORIENTATION=-